MRFIVMANGEYGEIEAYNDVFRNTDTIICADGGANYAFRIGIIPDCVIGDLDSVLPEVRKHLILQEVEILTYPAHKDLTDLQLAMNLAYERGADEIVLLGALGKRLDHTLHNLYSCIDLVQKEVKISHYTPECWVYIVKDEIVIQGTPGDIVSVIALTDRVEGAREIGFEYSLRAPFLLSNHPYTVSNVLAGSQGVIQIESGIVVVFHYF